MKKEASEPKRPDRNLGKPKKQWRGYCHCGCDNEYTMDVFCKKCGGRIILW